VSDDADAQLAFAASIREKIIERKEQYVLKQKNNVTHKAMRYICSAAGVDFKEVMRENEGVEPMTALCRSFLPPSDWGKVGLFLPDLHPVTAFSMFLIKPKKASERLESYLDEAMCIYPSSGYPIVGVVFLSSDKKLFVYCNAGVIDKAPSLMVKFNRKTRFIYSLDGFCRSLGLWKQNEMPED
jgi:hypothetical protein